jgi:hypothetical protein
MAEFADAAPSSPEDNLRKYVAIEKAYVDDRWADVLQRGEALLESLEDDDRELRQRVELLMAHTHLYGFGDRDSAEDLYRSVLESKAAAALRQIADQGLQHCNMPLQREAQPTDSEPPEDSISPEPSPILDSDPLPRPVAAPLQVGDEAVAHEYLAAPATARNVSTPPAEPSLEPVMPWLTEEPFQQQPWQQQTAPQSGEWLARERSPEPWDDAPATDEPEELLASQQESPPQTRATNQPAMPDWSPTASTFAPPPFLIPDVIEEPEMIEVHQTDPFLAEQIDLRESAPLAVMPAMEIDLDENLDKNEIPQTDAAFAEDPELLKGLLRVMLR